MTGRSAWNRGQLLGNHLILIGKEKYIVAPSLTFPSATPDRRDG